MTITMEQPPQYDAFAPVGDAAAPTPWRPRRLAGTIAGPTAGRGQAVVELALIVPLAFVLLMGVLEVGLLINTKLNLQAATRNAARMGTLDGQSANADYDIVRAITSTQNIDPSRITRIDIYKANPDGSMPTTSNSEDWFTLSPNGTGGYTATAGLIDWPPSQRRIVEPPQYLGVRLTYRYSAATPVFGAIGGIRIISDQTVMRLDENKGLDFVQVATPTDVPTDTPTATPTNTPIPTNTPTATATATPAPQAPPQALTIAGQTCNGASAQFSSVILAWTAPVSGTPSWYNIYDQSQSLPISRTTGLSYTDSFGVPLSAPLAFTVTASYAGRVSTPVTATVTQPCTPSSINTTIGYTSTGALSDTSDITELVGSMVTAPSGLSPVTSTTPITLHAYLGSITDLSVAQFAVYSNSSNAPNQLLWTSATTTTLTSTGLITVPLTAVGSPTLSPGGTYWLLMETATVDGSGHTHQDSSLATYFNYDSGGVSYSQPYSYTASLPNTAPSGNTSGGKNYTLYLSLTG